MSSAARSSSELIQPRLLLYKQIGSLCSTLGERTQQKAAAQPLNVETAKYEPCDHAEKWEGDDRSATEATRNTKI